MGQAFANQFEAVIEEVIYLGDTSTYMMKLVKDGTALMVKKQNKFATRQIKKGEKVSVGWNEIDNHLL